MKTFAIAAAVLVGCTIVMPTQAAPGDVYVPAHRTGNGLWVPANVPPSSGGTRMARKLNPKAAKPAATATGTSPLFVSAAPIRR
jgi:hypothetical protein